MHGYELDKPGHDPFEVAKAKQSKGLRLVLWSIILLMKLLEPLLFYSRSFAQPSNDYVANMRYWLSECSGALAPPEVAVHLLWSGGILINGARCGKFRVSANHQDPTRYQIGFVLG